MKTYLRILGFIIPLTWMVVMLAPQTASAQQYQFGFLSYSKILQTMPEYTQAQTALQTLKKKYEEEATYNEEKFKKMFADYLQGQKNFPEQIMLKRQKELQVAMEQGISFREDAKRLLGNAERELIQPLEAKLDSVLHLIGKENGLLFIGNSDGHNFPFIHNESGLDITEVVLARLNGTVIPINTATRVKSDTTTEPAPEGQTTTTPLSKEAENAKVSEILKSN
jgi:outer membrane protein